jgi:Tfp pilus assembly protein PilF
MKSWLGFATALVLVLPAAAAGADKAPRAQGQLDFGVDMAKRGLWSEALFRFRQAEKLGDDRSSVLNNIAVAYEALGQFEAAQDYYKKALERDPRNAGLKRNYSRFVEFYQSFKPDQPAAGAAPAAEAGSEPPPRAAPTSSSSDQS